MDQIQTMRLRSQYPIEESDHTELIRRVRSVRKSTQKLAPFTVRASLNLSLANVHLLNRACGERTSSKFPLVIWDDLGRDWMTAQAKYVDSKPPSHAVYRRVKYAAVET